MTESNKIFKIDVPEAVYESMLRVFIRLAVKKQNTKKTHAGNEKSKWSHKSRII